MSKELCPNCSLKCIATECECVCHTQPTAFNYGLKIAHEDELEFLRIEVDKYKQTEEYNQNDPYILGYIKCLEERIKYLGAFL